MIKQEWQDRLSILIFKNTDPVKINGNHLWPDWDNEGPQGKFWEVPAYDKSGNKFVIQWEKDESVAKFWNYDYSICKLKTVDSKQIGRSGRAETTVGKADTALAVGSGNLEVFATPMLTALMEKAAVSALDLEEGQTSVGTSLNIRHTSATPVGVMVRAEAFVVGEDGQTLKFNVVAYDSEGKIGEGQHERVIVDSGRFMAHTAQKLRR